MAPLQPPRFKWQFHNPLPQKIGPSLLQLFHIQMVLVFRIIFMIRQIQVDKEQADVFSATFVVIAEKNVNNFLLPYGRNDWVPIEGPDLDFFKVRRG